jgi:ribosomal protein L40E
LIRKSSLGAAKLVIGIMSMVVGLFITLFSGIAYMFQSFGGIADLGLVMVGLIFMFTGIWMVLDAAFSDVQVRVENLDELAAVMGKGVQKCRKCESLNTASASYCSRCGGKLSAKGEPA